MTIKTILFDFGGVLYKTINLNWLRKWKNLLGIVNDSEMIELLTNPNESSLIQDICLGRLPEEALWEKMANDWHIRPLFIKYFQRRMIAKSSLNKPMVKFLAALHKDFQTAILSSAGIQSRKLMEENFHLDRHVEDIIISAEEGVIKPDPQIYHIALARLDADPKQTLFLDDTLINVFSARELGMTAVQFINNQQAFEMVRCQIESEV